MELRARLGESRPDRTQPPVVGQFGSFEQSEWLADELASRNLDLTPSLNITRGSPMTPTIPNGFKVVKYWPIDVYEELFGDSLEESIQRGFLLNDITYFLEEKMVELWPQEEARLDRESSVVKWKDQVVQYDHIIEGDQEAPNLPDIVIKRLNEG